MRRKTQLRHWDVEKLTQTLCKHVLNVRERINQSKDYWLRDECGAVVAAVVALAVSGSGAVILSCLQGVDGVQ